MARRVGRNALTWSRRRAPGHAGNEGEGARRASPTQIRRLLLGTARADRKVFVTRDARILEVVAPMRGELLLAA